MVNKPDHKDIIRLYRGGYIGGLGPLTMPFVDERLRRTAASVLLDR